MPTGLTLKRDTQMCSLDPLHEALLALLVGLFGTLGVRDAWDQLRLREGGDCDAACVARAIPWLSWKVVAAFQVLAAFVLAVGAIACLYISG